MKDLQEEHDAACVVAVATPLAQPLTATATTAAAAPAASR
eukprot:CAMPEP_0183443310 /NCGR_PEP_ID=MMETSP0370-20130417/91302_1 /TAXON_ID=268820 /ORGANISM="Peridinium aciculiferum, Strain PAER-2" /LENGTH=39 /DNA_ID= /DNA_START= /DNA_END= /DNA_ORIENTATION=